MVATASPASLAVMALNRSVFALPLPIDPTRVPPEHAAHAIDDAAPLRALALDSASYVVAAASVPVTVSSTESLAGTLVLKLVATLLSVVAAHTFRTVAGAAVRPRSAQRTVIVAAVDVRLSRTTARR